MALHKHWNMCGSFLLLFKKIAVRRGWRSVANIEMQDTVTKGSKVLCLCLESAF